MSLSAQTSVSTKPLMRPNPVVPALLPESKRQGPPPPKQLALGKSEMDASSKPKKKKKKRHGPFRIKAGCIVAVRYRAGGNHLKRISPSGEVLSVDGESYSEVWTDPLPGRDEGLALIGRRVRCCFPKSVLEGDQSSSSATTRIVEGEIVSLIDYDIQWLLQRERRRKREPCFTAVELLVDRSVLSAAPFLERTDEDVDTATMSSKEKKRHGFEQIIQGKHTVTVKVNLGDTSRIAVVKGATNGEGPLVAKWVIRKRVKLFTEETKPSPSNDATSTNGQTEAPAEGASENGGKDAAKPPPKKKRRKTNKGKQAATMFLGDGNDPQPQQERNWRWFAGRHDDMLLSDGKSAGRPEDLSCGLVGEVLTVDSTATATNATGASTLATVTIRRLLLPEHSKSGRMSYHGPCDVFDDADSCGMGDGKDAVAMTKFQVPVEELVIVARKLERRYDESPSSTNGSKAGIGISCPTITQAYSFNSDTYRGLSKPAGEGADSSIAQKATAVCHRCRRSSGTCAMERLSSSSALQDVEKLMCNSCQKALRQSRPAESAARCDCQDCSMCSESHLETLMKFDVAQAFDALHRTDGESQEADECPAGSDACAVCGQLCSSPTRCETCNAVFHVECAKWDKQVDGEMKKGVSMPKFRCRTCRFREGEPRDGGDTGSEAMAQARIALQALRPTDFDLPSTFMDLKSLPVPSEKPVTLSKSRRPRGLYKKTQRKTSSEGKTVQKKEEQSQADDALSVSQKGDEKFEETVGDVFTPSCSRLLPYEPSKKRFTGAPKQQMKTSEGSIPNPETRKVSRQDEAGRTGTGAKSSTRKRTREPERVVENKATSRAARANQRRMMKGVAALGASGLGMDALAGREQQLRFDRSSIHAWGVFADEGINEGDMIVEYRGELIGNAVAEEREKEYEKAKIGSDYMFRIDHFLVCDATKQGNVARFINASCDPNCYTQIITLNGVKRIVIYAKRDIKAGEELCYDYKFPFEFDESKRIECHCGAKVCRGFMNWDKRYVALPNNKLGAANDTS